MSFEVLGDIVGGLFEIANAVREGKNSKDDSPTEKSKIKAPISMEQYMAELQSNSEPKDMKSAHSMKISPIKTVVEEKLKDEPISYELNKHNVLQAVVFSELLVEPVCKRRRRCRSWR